MKICTLFKSLILIIVIGLSSSLSAQNLQDDFSDGDFTNNPTWLGDAANFIVNGSNQLQINAPSGSGNNYLYTAANIQDTARWEFLISYGFSPSSSNRIRVYLQSNSNDLSGNLDGYYLQIGETGSNDALEIFRQDGGSSSSILRGTDGQVATATDVRVRITRTSTGDWTLEADYTGGTTYVNEGTATDATYQSGTAFGVRVFYTSSNVTNTNFDDFFVSPLFVDVIPPAVLSATAISATEVDVLFDEPVASGSADIAGNYTMTNGITVTNAIIDGTNPALVHLTVSPALTNQTSYQVIAGNIDDLNGNTLTSGSTNFTYLVIAAATYQDIVINEIMADPDPAVGLPAGVEFIELYNRTSNGIDISNFVFYDGSNRTLPNFLLAPNSYVIVCDDSDTAALSSYGDVIAVSSMGLTNSGEALALYDDNGTLIDTVDYETAWYNDTDKDDGGWTLELINPNLACWGATNWTASNDVNGGTPGTQNSVFDNTPDTQGPTAVSADFISSNEVYIVLSEPLNASSANTASNFSISGGLNVVSAVFHAPDTVYLTLDANMTSQTTYTITVNTGLEDCNSNPQGSTSTADFTFFAVEVPAYRDLIFNELFPDPTPVVGLPEAEFIEIYNRSNKYLDLTDLVFFDGSDHILPSFILQPDSFVTICSNSDLADFQALGTTIGVSSIGLTNAGEYLSISLPDGTIIDSLTYSSDWYNNNAKDDGGWSMELINPEHACKGGENWQAAGGFVGGSPSAQNTNYNNTLDTDLPGITEVRQYSPMEIQITFDEVMDLTAMGQLANYSINNGLSIINVSVLNSTEVLLTLDASMINNTTYEITLNGVSDCVGNSLAGFVQVLTYYELDLSEHYDILINEIFADYNPQIGLPEKEFVELYNRSTNVISLEGFTFTDGTSNVAILPFVVLQPGEYLVIYSDEDTIGYTQFGTSLALADFPDLDVGGDELVLRDAVGTVVDAVSYDQTWYQNTDKDDGGWTLERINPSSPCEGSTNWIASTNLLGGTPAQANSVLNDVPDTQQPDILRAYPFATDSIRLYFTEAVDETNAATVTNYTMDNGVNVTSAYVEAPFYNTVVIGLDAALQIGTTYTITMESGFTDCVGNSISSINSTMVALPEQIEVGDVILNEILFNPVTGGNDFIELYNNSSKVINVGDLILANSNDQGITLNQTDNVETDWLLFPQEYVVLTEEPSQVKETYATPNPNNFIENDIPSYADDEGTFIMFVTYGVDATIIDQFYYLEDYHTALLDDEDGVSLERIDPSATTQDKNNWHSAATSVGYATPAYENSSFLANTITETDFIQLPDENFSPDSDGYEDFLLINYNLDALGYVGTVHIYDANGQLVRQLINGELLMDEGTWQWDGADDNGERVPVGIYIISVEAVNPNGDVRRAKKSCVVASFFD